MSPKSGGIEGNIHDLLCAPVAYVMETLQRWPRRSVLGLRNVGNLIWIDALRGTETGVLAPAASKIF